MTVQIKGTMRKDFELEVELEPVQTYTLGIYYFYLEGYEGSSDIYAWHDNWEEWCRWIVGYKANLLADYCDGEMPIEFVIKHGMSVAGHLDKPTMYGIIKNLEGYYDVDLCVVITEDNLHAGLHAYPGLHTVQLRGLRLENAVRGMEGERYNGEYLIGFTLAHEIGHLFRLNHCSSPPCPMSQCQIRYNDWLNMGKRLWFCNVHRPQILKNWKERNYS